MLNREEVRAAIRFRSPRAFTKIVGVRGFAARNCIVRGTPLENIEAFLDERHRYGNE